MSAATAGGRPGVHSTIPCTTEPFRSLAALKALQAEAGVLVGTTSGLPAPPATTKRTREIVM